MTEIIKEDKPTRKRSPKVTWLLLLGFGIFLFLAPPFKSARKSDVEIEKIQKIIDDAIAKFNKYEMKLDKDFLADTKIIDMENDLSRQFLLDKIDREILPLWRQKCQGLLTLFDSHQVNRKMTLYLKKYIRLKTDYFTYWQLYMKTQDEKFLRKAESVFKKVEALRP
jgi:hypothetical protein